MGACSLYHPERRLTWRWREEIDGGACKPGRVWPYSGGVRSADRCNRNRAGQVGASLRSVKRWRGRALLACSSSGGGGAGPGGAVEENCNKAWIGEQGRQPLKTWIRRRLWREQGGLARGVGQPSTDGQVDLPTNTCPIRSGVGDSVPKIRSIVLLCIQD